MIHLAKQPKIKINPEHKGAFTSYCKQQGFNGVTNECIEKGLKSDDPEIRKQANFARNSRKWNHKKEN